MSWRLKESGHQNHDVDYVEPADEFSLGLTLIPVYLSDHMLTKVWDEITYPFTNFSGCTVEVWNGSVISYHTL